MIIERDLTTVNISGKRPRKPVGIVLHSMDGFFDGTRSWFKNPSAGGSAHYLISKKGKILQMVDDMVIAWHCRGMTDLFPPRAYWNDITIGIELEDERKREAWVYPQEEIDALVWLCDHLGAKWGFPINDKHIFLHRILDPGRRSDPVGNFNLEWVVGGGAMDNDKLKKAEADRDRNWRIGYQQLEKIGDALGVGRPNLSEESRIEERVNEYSKNILNKIAERVLQVSNLENKIREQEKIIEDLKKQAGQKPQTFRECLAIMGELCDKTDQNISNILSELKTLKG